MALICIPYRLSMQISRNKWRCSHRVSLPCQPEVFIPEQRSQKSLSHASTVAVGMVMLTSHFGPDWNVSSSAGNSFMDFHGLSWTLPLTPWGWHLWFCFCACNVSCAFEWKLVLTFHVAPNVDKHSHIQGIVWTANKQVNSDGDSSRASYCLTSFLK